MVMVSFLLPHPVSGVERLTTRLNVPTKPRPDLFNSKPFEVSKSQHSEVSQTQRAVSEKSDITSLGQQTEEFTTVSLTRRNVSG